ncbi:tetratricopeptide repeat protein [Microbacterium suaedae]|uniref:tetratricopeptide repeat protein n=2 Tax=Microbacterium suaedae TaxID=2067813 RepID=UPI001E5B4D90|nr:tetratricopeptide repeat protein [Microbacterium suaedae]
MSTGETEPVSADPAIRTRHAVAARSPLAVTASPYAGAMSPDEWERRIGELWEDADVSDDGRIEAMLTLANEAPHPALGAFELGGAFDSAGREFEAHAQYEAAADAGLADVDVARAAQLAVQHASTLRNLGRENEAIAMLRDAPAHATVGAAPAVFLALALHSAGRHDEALRVAIEALEPTLPQYRRSVRAYVAELTAE